jgi:hypothetical protein
MEHFQCGYAAHELAARLSYFLAGSTPDAPLTAAADAGGLNAPEVVREHALRLLSESRTQANLTAFHRAWLNTELVPGDRDTTLFPTFTGGIALFMAAESRLFFQNVLFGQSGSLRDLYTAPYTFANNELAAFYGVPAPATPWARVELDPTQRAGIITHELTHLFAFDILPDVSRATPSLIEGLAEHQRQGLSAHV